MLIWVPTKERQKKALTRKQTINIVCECKQIFVNNHNNNVVFSFANNLNLLFFINSLRNDKIVLIYFFNPSKIQVKGTTWKFIPIGVPTKKGINE